MASSTIRNGITTLFILTTAVLFTGCDELFSSPDASIDISSSVMTEEFKSYWFAGKAEICYYDLSQARYSELRQGQAVMIFVTEPFSRSNHLKLEGDASGWGADQVDVLKLNFSKDFYTGMYPYHMMTSVFTPLDRKFEPNTLLITNTCQEWCGQTFTRIDHDNGYDLDLYSYFPSEGVQHHELETTITEDEIWNLIRIDPALLPTGEFDIIESTMYQRLSHETPQVRSATGGVEPYNDDTLRYFLNIEERELNIFYEPAFPFRILGWTETYQDGPNGQVLTTEAWLRSTVATDFWNKKSNADRQE